MIEFELEIYLGSQKLDVVPLSVNDKPTLGSSPDSRIQLLGDRVKPHHAEFRVIDSQWHIRSVEGEIRIAGDVAPHALVELNKPISLGPYILKIKLAETRAEVLLSEDINQQDKAKTDKNSKLDLIINKAQSLIRSMPFVDKLNINEEKIALLWSPKYRLRTILGAVIVVLSFMLIDFGDSPADTSEELTQVKYDVQTLREIERYESWVAELLLQQDFPQALTILNAAIAKRPDVIEFSEQRAQVVSQFVDFAIEQRTPGKAEVLFKIFNEDNTDAAVSKSIKKLQDALEQKKQHLANYEVNKRIFDETLAKANASLVEGKPEEAEAILLSLNEITEFEPEWQNQVVNMQAQIDRGLVEIEKQRNAQLQQEIQGRKLTVELFKQCIASYNDKNIMQAYLDCTDAKQASVSLKNPLVLEIDVWLDVLEPEVAQQMNTWNAKAEDCFKTGWIGCALENWNKMIRYDSNNKELTDRIESVIDQQRVVAKRLFNEARAYIDLGRESDAAILLNELKKELPIDSEEFFQRADQMLAKIN